MSNSMFVLALAVGAALLAAWIHARFPALAPERLGRTMLHTGVAFALLRLLPGVGESPLTAFAAILLFVLPALVYALLCAIWMLKHVQTAMGVSR
jgi:hypothetical protein